MKNTDLQLREMGRMAHEMNGILLVDIFVKVVDDLVAQPRLFAYSNHEQCINFRSEDFRKKLTEVIQTMSEGTKMKSILRDFKILQLIVCDENRFTNTQFINGKSVRVITVDRHKYDLLKALEWEDIH